MKKIRKMILAALAAAAVLFTAVPMPADVSEAASKMTIEKVDTDLYAISAKMSLDGSGTGYHGKIVMGNSTSAVSFGIQFDQHSSQEKYRGKGAFMIENVASNDPGMQKYTWIKGAKTKKTYTIMMTVDAGNGEVTVYANGKELKTVKNKGLIGEAPYFRVEGSARLNGDKVKVRFSNVKVKQAGSAYHSDDQIVQWVNFVDHQSGGIKAYDEDTMSKIYERQQIIPGQTVIYIKGKLKGVSGDWDSNYEDCSAIVNFTTYNRYQVQKTGEFTIY